MCYNIIQIWLQQTIYAEENDETYHMIFLLKTSVFFFFFVLLPMSDFKFSAQTIISLQAK